MQRKTAQCETTIQAHSRRTSTSNWNQRKRLACCERRASIAASNLSMCRQIFPAKSRANANSAQTALSRRRVAVAWAKRAHQTSCREGRTQPTQGNLRPQVESHRHRSNCTNSTHLDSPVTAKDARSPPIHDDSTDKSRSLRPIPSTPRPCTRHTQDMGTRTPAESLRV